MLRVSIFLIAFFCISILTNPNPMNAEVPNKISYQGVLIGSDCQYVPDGSYSLTFKMYDVSSGGSALWTEAQSVTVKDGVFSVVLGESTSLNLDFDVQYWLGITVGGGSEISERVQLASSPYAITSSKLSAEGWASADIKQLIRDFVVASGKSVTAGDVVSFLDGYIQKGLDTDINYGSEYEFNSAFTLHISSAALSSTKFVVAYSDGGNSSYGTAIIGNVSSNTISYGSEYVFNAASTDNISAAALSSNKFVVAYRDGGNSNYGTAIIGDVSGTTITYGSEYVFNAAYTLYISAAALSSNKFVVTYRDDTFYGTTIIGDVSGTTISYGSEYVFNAATTSYISAAAFSSTKFVVSYKDGGNSDYGTAIIGDVSGTTISYGTGYVFNEGYTTINSAAVLSSTKIVVAYKDGGNSNYGTAIIGDVSGATISYGSEFVFNSATTDNIFPTVLSSTLFVVTYQDGGNSSHGTAIIGDVSGTTISYGSEYVFNADPTSYISTAALSSNKFVVTYRDGGNSNYGTAIIGGAPGKIIGIAKEAKTAGQDAPVIIHGVSDMHSGLTIGATYYMDNSGNLTTTTTDYKIGLAISATEILLDIEIE